MHKFLVYNILLHYIICFHLKIMKNLFKIVFYLFKNFFKKTKATIFEKIFVSYGFCLFFTKKSIDFYIIHYKYICGMFSIAIFLIKAIRNQKLIERIVVKNTLQS
ncbi:hypothetical protein EDEG_01984 [Edhazardia aedis USNM 41457]|uniref:Uncharacterized protein n=1 Tax=Edhazardia aedis (strain USNM 41457) TaxID=1003232 RepID=J9DM97_EDHAE|nr:hypothetical protein EDEG_01984 [Edhazardia aedis USNM 41457]|eukprot:EJW03720.1 hypothetical protein EDEG_01984 [Edhazardia aedis USNM 41457]